MKSEEIKGVVCEHIQDDSRVWIFVRNGDDIYRTNIGFGAMELVGMAAVATNEICRIIGEKNCPIPVERKYIGVDPKEPK